MKNIFDLTKREQRLVIVIVVTLVVVAFAKHWIDATSNPARTSAPAQELRTSRTATARLSEKEMESPSPQSSP